MEVSTTTRNRQLIVLSGFLLQLKPWGSVLGTNVITVFLDQARSGGPLTVHGDGEQTRDFVHVRDVVRANLVAAADDEPGRVYNVGTGESITIRGLAALVRETVGDSAVSIEHVSSRDGDIDRNRTDIGRIVSELGFEPSVMLADGLTEL